MEKEEILKEKIAALEALLFYYGEPLTIEKIAFFLGESLENVKLLIEKLASDLKKNNERGLEIIKNGEKVELVTKAEFGHILKKVVEEEFSENITPAALETLSIIAYLGPVTRAQIDYIRGVNSTFILRNLLIRGLIVRNLQPGKKNTYEYAVSFDFLKHLGIKSVEELPEYEKYRAILNNFALGENVNGEEENNNNLNAVFNNNSSNGKEETNEEEDM